MRIGLNLLFLIPGEVGGTETYSLSLIDALSEIDSTNEYFVLVNKESESLRLPDRPNFHRIVCPVHASHRPWRFLWEQFVLPVRARMLGLDVLHSLGYVGPLFPPCNSVVTIHDLNYDAIPEAFTWFTRVVQRFFVTQSARHSDHIIAVSEFTRGEMVRLLGVPGSKISAIHEAPKPRKSPADPKLAWMEIRERFSIDRPYLMAFGSLSPHKNLARLVEAFARMEDRSEYQLVLVGHVPPTGPSLPGLAQELGVRQDVVLTGYLSDEQIEMLLVHAALFVFPSLYEGFGLPVLEAMAAGAPVACSRCGSLPEIGGRAAVYFDALNVEEMSATLSAILKDERRRQSLLEHGRQNLERFSWERAARETADVYDGLADERRDMKKSQNWAVGQ